MNRFNLFSAALLLSVCLLHFGCGDGSLGSADEFKAAQSRHDSLQLDINKTEIQAERNSRVIRALLKSLEMQDSAVEYSGKAVDALRHGKYDSTLYYHGKMDAFESAHQYIMGDTAK